MKTAAIVLCGGESKRMGRAKAWLPFGDQTLLHRVVDRVGQAVASVIVVAADGQAVPELPPAVKVVYDEEPNRGPLGGLATGLRASAGQCDAVFLSACDSPFVSTAVIERLFDLLGDHDICIPQVGNRLHPLAAAYSVRVEAKVRSHLAMSRLRLLDLTDQLRTRVVTESELIDMDPGFKMFQNLNTPADYQQALRDAGFA